MWAANEERSFSRLAALHLETEPETPGEWLRKLEVLAELALRGVEPRGLVLAVPGAHWSEEHVCDVRSDALDWLAGCAASRGALQP